MKVISAHVTGFYRSSFHAYTTEVTVDGHRWRLGLRYSKFHEFYDRLLVQEKDFHADFPPKGTLFFTPKPEERQEQLEVFLQQVLAYYAAKRHPTEIEDLLCDLLKVPRHLRFSKREDDDVSTSTESVLDEPMHEPVAIEMKDSKEEEKTQAAEAVALQVVTTEVVAVKEGETDTVASELAQPVSPTADEHRSVELTEEPQIALDTAESGVKTPALAVAPELAQPVSLAADEPRSVELTEEAQIALDTAESEAETPALAEESEVAEETIKEDIATADKEDIATADKEDMATADKKDMATADKKDMATADKEDMATADKEDMATADKEVIQEEEADLTLPLVPVEQFAAETEEAAKNDTILETYLEDLEVPSIEETYVVLPTKQSVVKSIAHEYTPSKDEERAVSEGSILEEIVKPKELATSGRASSWIAVYWPKSLLGFFRRRCMKKTNLVVLCVALLLPMVLGRRQELAAVGKSRDRAQ